MDKRPEPPLSSEARALIAPGLTPAAVVERLQAKDLHEDAMIFTAYVLTERDLAWWGCLCAWKEARPEPLEKEAEAFRACLRWIQKPGEETRRAAAEAAAVAGLDTPAGAVAQAVFFSGGSISGPGLPEVKPAPEVMSNLILGALRVAAARENPKQLDGCFRRYVWLASDPLQRLSKPAAPRPEPAVDGSIASRWTDASESAAPAANTPAATAATPIKAPTPPPTPAPAPTAARPSPPRTPAPPPAKKKTAKPSGDELDRDAWEGMSKLEDE